MPRIIGWPPTDRWEKNVVNSLQQQLPDDWVIIPNVRWTLEKNGYVRDGEADLVVLAPEVGLVVVEIKGSREFRVGRDGIWQRKLNNGLWQSLDESPAEQATRNMYDLVAVIQKKLNWKDFQGRYSYLVIYPQGKAISLPAMFDESTLATYRHMNQLATRLRNSLDKRGYGAKAELLSNTAVESVIDILKNRKFEILKADTADDVSTDMEKIDELTRQQYASLRGLFHLPSVAVIGPAGAGKTILAIWRLRALVEFGMKVAYVCYNRSLAEFLRLQNPEYKDAIHSVDKLFNSYCPDDRLRSNDSNYYRKELPWSVVDRSDQITKYDEIIIDEGQDFSEEQLIALHELLDEDGAWALFADWKQDLYKAGKETPIGAEVVFHLHYNCRNTERINYASNRYLRTDIESMPGMPVGHLPLVEVVRDQAAKAWELVNEWAGDGSIAILSPFTYEKSAMYGRDVGYGQRLSTTLEDLGNKGIVFFSTIKSFKGIEASVVIVVDVSVPDVNDWFMEEDLYVACTRARTRLALISSRKDVTTHYKVS